MRFDVVTLFPELFSPFLESGFVGKAQRQGVLSFRFSSPRSFGLGQHRSVDDTPYGGGSGMVLRVDVLVNTMEALDLSTSEAAHRVLLTPQGTPLKQSHLHALAARPAVMLVCGRYEGFDERVRHYVQEEISLGDFVLTGGEVAAMALIEGCVRLLPGVLGNPDSIREESHGVDNDGLLEYPQYTRPAEFRGEAVPSVLTQGHHAEIKAWRQQTSKERTCARRPDLLPLSPLSRGGS